ncbi:MAG: 4-hydroxyphenylpyruvate dioxygenase [Legionellales bacterium RIFCSPHIGHO2_12_FULL_37_14]|nr:MAG: 4-hydroxyphenylpyruvate dioxygenase [Legionellales bacterium RIFCSPHIGHO2_12_FULL_37_14]
MMNDSLKGFAFLEFAAPDPKLLHAHFKELGFTKVETHNPFLVTLYQQNKISFIVNETQDSQAHEHAKVHGPGASAMGFLVEDVEKTYTHLLKKGAKPHTPPQQIYDLPAIEAIGGSVIYLVDQNHQPFHAIKNANFNGAGLQYIDHLTHNVYRGNMDKWALFYQDLFDFKQIRYFNIEGQKTGLISRALGSKNGKIKIPLNESKDDHSQIEEFLHEYKGEGIQHIALHTANIYQTIKTLRKNKITFLDVPDVYYEYVDKRIPWHKEPLAELQKQRILIDGEKEESKGLLLQIFTENIFGPEFFEIIQRKGNDGFGEGNFQALFEAIERDQIRRGTLK